MDTNRDSIKHGFEVTDAPASSIVVAGILVAVLTLLAMVAAWFYVKPNGPADGAPPLGRERLFTHGAEQRSSIEQSWMELERDQQERASADNQAPVTLEQAIDLVVEDSRGESQQPETPTP